MIGNLVLTATLDSEKLKSHRLEIAQNSSRSFSSPSTMIRSRIVMTFLKAWSKLKRTFLLGASLALLLVSSSKLVHGQYYPTMPQNGVPPHVVQNSVGYSHVEKGETEPQPDVDQTSSQSTKPTASEIWSAFLLGSPKAKKVSKPKFAFSRNENVSNCS